MGQCESCVNTTKTAKGSQSISYGQGKKRHHKTGGGTGSSRRNSMSTGSYDRKLFNLQLLGVLKLWWHFILAR